ncbi:pilus assembly protein [Archangium sp.]|uniref:pilus assembly protein n=1 Tax=Archangium sp. TaxID=1872627 RepID=UPI00286B0CE1|nr:pilus assembly protein [Archangium sp.]
MKPHSNRRAPRGQAMTELALGLLVFVTVLIFGIHFAEMGYLSVKVTEATHSALLDATGGRLHNWPMNSNPAKGTAARAGQQAAERYRDFDSRTASNNGASLSQVFTTIEGLEVECSTGNGPSYMPSPLLLAAYSDVGGMSCRAQANIRPLGAYSVPEQFMEGQGGFFKARHYVPKNIPVCGMGRARGGTCPGRLTMMLDDWGLSGDRESGICPIIPDMPIPCPTNVPFWTMAASAFAINLAGQGTAGSAMASGVVGSMPLPFFYGGENMFWMSSAGEPLFVQPLFNEMFAPRVWPTTPGVVPGGLGGIPYTAAYIQRRGCFLGQDCPK